MVLAGYSKDIKFSPSSSLTVWPLVVLYNSVNDLMWIKQSSLEGTATDVAFSNDYSKIIATLEGSNSGVPFLAITYLWTVNGTKIFTKIIYNSSYKLPAKVAANSMLPIKDSEKVFIVFTQIVGHTNILAFGNFGLYETSFQETKNQNSTQVQVLSLIKDEAPNSTQLFHFISYVTDPFQGDKKYNYLSCYNPISNYHHDSYKISLRIQDSDKYNKCQGIHFQTAVSQLFYSLISYVISSKITYYVMKIDLANQKIFKSTLDHYNYGKYNSFSDTAFYDKKFYFIGSTRQFGYSPSQLYYTYKIGIIGEFDDNNEYSLFDSKLIELTDISILQLMSDDQMQAIHFESIIINEIWDVITFDLDIVNEAMNLTTNNLILKPDVPETSWILTKESVYIDRSDWLKNSDPRFYVPVILNVSCKDQVNLPSFTITHDFPSNEKVLQANQPSMTFKVYINSNRNCFTGSMNFPLPSLVLTNYLISDPMVIVTLPRATSFKPECDIIYKVYQVYGTSEINTDMYFGLDIELFDSDSPIAYNDDNHQLYIYSNSIRQKGLKQLKLTAEFQYDSNPSAVMYINITFDSLCTQDGDFMNVPSQSDVPTFSVSFTGTPVIRQLGSKNWTYVNDSTIQYCPPVTYTFLENGDSTKRDDDIKMLTIVDQDVFINITDITMCRQNYLIKMLAYVGLQQREVDFIIKCSHDCITENQVNLTDMTYNIKKDGNQSTNILKWSRKNADHCFLDYLYKLAIYSQTDNRYVEIETFTNENYCGQIKIQKYKNSTQFVHDDGLLINDNSQNSLKFLASTETHYRNQPYRIDFIIFHNDFDQYQNSYFRRLRRSIDLEAKIAQFYPTSSDQKYCRIYRLISLIDNTQNIKGVFGFSILVVDCDWESLITKPIDYPTTFQFEISNYTFVRSSSVYNFPAWDKGTNVCGEIVYQVIEEEFSGWSLDSYFNMTNSDNANITQLTTGLYDIHANSETPYKFLLQAKFEKSTNIVTQHVFRLFITNFCRNDTNIVKPVFNTSEPDQILPDILSWFTLIKATSNNSNCDIITYDLTYPQFTKYEIKDDSIYFKNSPTQLDIQSNQVIYVNYTDKTGYKRTVNKSFKVVQSCNTNVVIVPNDQRYGYYYNTLSKNISLVDVSSSLSYCGDIKFIFVNDGDLTFNSGQHFNETNNNLSLIYSEKDVENLRGSTHTILIFANQTYSDIYIQQQGLVPILSSGVFKISITFIGCLVKKLTVDQADQNRMASLSYQVGQQNQVNEFNEFIKDPPCNVVPRYEIFINGLQQTILEDFVTLSYNSITQKHKLIIYTKNNDLASQSPFFVQIKGTIENYDNSLKETYLNITLTIKQENTSPPQFKEPPPEEFTFNAMVNNQILRFPQFYDEDGDKIGSVKIDFGVLKQYITGQFPNFRISPGFNSMGEYPVSILVQDDNNNPLSQVFNFNLKIQQETIQIPSENQTNNEGNGEGTQNQEQGGTNNYVAIQIITNPSLISQNLNAKIKSISNQGIVRVTFNRAIFIPQNYSSFNNNITLIEIYTNENKKSEIKFTWQIFKFSSQEFQVQLYFDDPAQVSRNVSLL
eukprot:403367058